MRSRAAGAPAPGWLIAWRRWKLRHAPVPPDGLALSLDEERKFATAMRGYGDAERTARLALAGQIRQALMAAIESADEPEDDQ